MDGRILALMSAMCFGINPIVLRPGLGRNNANIAVLVGLLAGLPVLVLLSLVLGGLQLDQLSGLAVFYFVLGGLFGVVLGRGALYRSIRQLGSTRATTFKNGAPVVTAILAPIFLYEAVGLGRWGGIILVTVGLMMVGRRVGQLQSGPVRATALVIACLTPIFYGIRPIFSKMGLDLAPLPLAATLIGYLAAVAVYMAYFLYRRELSTLKIGQRDLSLFAIAGLLQVTGLLLLNFALQSSEVSRIYPISASAPLITFVLTYTILKNIERLTLSDLVGTLLVVGGVIWLLV